MFFTKKMGKEVVPSRHALFLGILLYSFESNFVSIMYHVPNR